MKKLLSMCFVAAMLLAGCGGEESKEKEKLTVLTNSGYPPYEVVDNKGYLSGFDIDIINAIAEETGYEIEIKDVDFDTLIPSIQTGKADMAIAGITPSAERRKKVDFSEVYFSGETSQNYLLYSEKNGITSQDDLKGKTIGCQMGTVQYEAALHFEETQGAKVDAKKDYAAIVAELKKGNNDAAIVEKAVAMEFSEENPDFKYVKINGLADLEGNAICFKKGSPLVEEINAAIKTLKENGTIDKLAAKYPSLK